ncbi:MAG: hypothetical protein JKY96_09135 [Phycisphaerales bacterium]|nr:hypothetical protein [Phycisphaerales bacterium]
MHNNPEHPNDLTPLREITKVSFTNIFGWAHAILGFKWGLLVLAALLLTIYNFTAGAITSLIDIFMFGPVWISPFNTLHTILVVTPLSVGPIYIAAKIFRGERADFGDLFVGFRRWGSVVLIGLIIQVALLVAMIPFGIAGGILFVSGGGNIIIGLLVLLLFLVMLLGIMYVGVRIYFATLLCADPLGPQLSVTESISESWRITRTSALTLFGTAIVIGAIAGICLMFLILPGILYGLPLVYAAAGAVYVVLTHKHAIIPLSGYDECPYCEYDLRGTEETICPECGSTVIRNMPEPQAEPNDDHSRHDQAPPPDEPPIELQ